MVAAAVAVVEGAAAVAANLVDKNATTFSQLPRLGVGLGYRDAYQPDVFRHRSSIDFLEIVADHFFGNAPPRQRQLQALQSSFVLIPHGLALSIGSAEGPDNHYLKLLATLVARVAPPWWSEHIAFTRAGGIDIGHLTALPKTRETLQVLKANLDQVKQSIAVPLLLENITESILYPGEQMRDAEFLTCVLEQNDCGLLLDVTNLYANSVNYRFDPLPVLWGLPKDRIVQLHIVGGHWEGGKFIDSHSSPVSPEIWQLAHEVLKFAPVKGIILERDEQFPPISELLTELEHARSLQQATAMIGVNGHGFT